MAGISMEKPIATRLLLMNYCWIFVCLLFATGNGQQEPCALLTKTLILKDDPNVCVVNSSPNLGNSLGQFVALDFSEAENEALDKFLGQSFTNIMGAVEGVTQAPASFNVKKIEGCVLIRNTQLVSLDFLNIDISGCTGQHLVTGNNAQLCKIDHLDSQKKIPVTFKGKLPVTVENRYWIKAKERISWQKAVREKEKKKEEGQNCCPY